jgi:polar amino acid transport system permease protein
MGYTLVYTQVLEFFPYLIRGALISLQIAILAFFGGMFFGLIFATIRTFGNKLMNNLVIWYVTFFTNTPAVSSNIFFIFCPSRVWYFIISFCSSVR